jgi:hypothetical protein
MPTINLTVTGIVTGLWGAALRRTPGGRLLVLKMGDLIHKGDVILTTQDGIVRLSAEPETPHATSAAQETAPATELDRVIAGLNQPDSRDAPAAGLNPGDGSGLLPGLRVDRITEDLNPATFNQAGGLTAPRSVADRFTATEDQLPQATTRLTPNALPTAAAGSAAGSEDATLPISLRGQDSDGTVNSVTITSIPTGSALLLSDGVTPVVAGQTISAAQAATLLFRPAPDFNGGTAVTFTVTDNQGGTSSPTTLQINVLAVNDAPVAAATTATGPEDSPISLSLGGTDLDSSVTGITITGAPANGNLFLADGATRSFPAARSRRRKPATWCSAPTRASPARPALPSSSPTTKAASRPRHRP